MPAAFYDFFRKIILKSTDGITVETEIEADSFTDELTIIRGRGVAFNGDSSTDTFSINVDYDLSVPLGTTDIALTDVNNNNSLVTLTAGSNITLTRISSNEIRFDSSDLTISIIAATQTNPVRITTDVPHGLVNGASITIQDVVGMTDLNGNSYFVNTVAGNSSQIDLYLDDALTTTVNGTGFGAYVSGGNIAVQNTATLEALLDVDIDTVSTNDVLVYNGTRWVDTDSLTLASLTTTTGITSNNITARTAAGLTISSIAGGQIFLGDGVQNGIVINHNSGAISIGGTGNTQIFGAAGSTVTIGNGTSGTVTIGSGTNTVDFPAGTTVDFTGAFVTANIIGDVLNEDGGVVLNSGTNAISAVFTGNLTGNVTGNASTATKLATVRTIGGVNFDGTASIDLPGVNTGGNQSTTGNANTATALQTARNFSIGGGGITATAVSFDGTQNVVLNASIDNDSVALGTKTTGNYVATVSGTANEIDVTGSGVETAGVTLSIPNNFVVPQDLTVSRDLIVTRNLIVQGSLTSLETTNTAITDNIVVLNQGESGTGVSAGASGIEVERGITDNARFVWDELTDSWQAQLSASGNWLLANLTGNFVGDLKGSVFGDDSTPLVDAINNRFVGPSDTADRWTTTRTITLGGEVTSDTVNIDGSGNVTISNVSVTNFSERVRDTIALAFANGTQSGLTFTHDDPNDTFSLNVNDFTVTLGGDLTGSVTITDLASATLTATIAANSVALGTDTTGDYVESLVAGTGISLTNNTGEGATPTIATANIPNSSLTNSSITITDGVTPEIVDLGETITFFGGTNLSVAVAATNNVTFSHTTSGVGAGTYGNGTNLMQISVDAQGHITSVTNRSFPSPTITLSGQVTGSATLTQLSNATITTSLSASINALNDVNTTTNKIDGYFLQWNSATGNWVPAAVGGTSVPTLQDVSDQGTTTNRTITFSNTTAGGSGAGIIVDEIVSRNSGTNTLIINAPISTNSTITATDTVTAPSFVGDFKGSLFADNSTLLVDAVNGQIPYSVVTGGPGANLFTEFYYDGGSVPVGQETGSQYLGETRGTWSELTAANRANNRGPVNSAYNPTLTGIAYDTALDSGNGGFKGFAQGSTYDIEVDIEVTDTGVANEVQNYTMKAVSSSNQLKDAKAKAIVLTDLSTQTYTVKMRILVTFEDSDTNNNWIQATLHQDQDPSYYIVSSSLKIIKVS